MYSGRDLLDIVGSIYAAVDDQTLWPDFLERLANTIHSQATNLFVQDLRHSGGAAFATFGTDPSFNRSYSEYYGTINIFLLRGKSLLNTGNVCFSDELCPNEEAFRSEFFNEWVLPQGQGHGLLGTIFNNDSVAGNVGAIRARTAKPFTIEDKRLVQALMPHLQRAVDLRARTAHLEALEKSTTDALNRWTTGLFLVDHKGQIIFANRTAEDMLRKCDGFFAKRGILETTRSSDTLMLHRLIREAVATTIDRNDQANHTMLIERIPGKGLLQILVTPSVREDIFFGRRGTALVFVSDPEAQRTQSEVLRDLYRLTPAEAAVASRLADGKSVKEIADGAAVRENTIRIHLKRIFDKTGTKRQAELVKLVLSGPAALRTRG
jgi:DNA-binding CsgD family transcriptional regulator/PAS domain-containing protein